MLNCLATGVALTGFTASIIAVSFTTVYTNPRVDEGTRKGETLRSWTCTWSFNGGDKSEVVDDFGRLCRETEASFVIMCVLVAMQFAFCLLAGSGWWLEKDVRQKRYENSGVLPSDKAEQLDV